MKSTLYDEKLKYFKENEQPEIVLLIADEPHLIRIVVAWSNVRIRRAKRITHLQNNSDSAVWNWLWENTSYSREDLLLKSAVPENAFDAKMSVLIGNRVLYPDGTINSLVQRYLHNLVLKIFDSKPKRKKKILAAPPSG
jgi:isocitrate dehydrogenase kinase/phosphatase